jgi:cell filamentation protein
MSPFANDPYCYPGTDVLRNLADIRDPEALESFEADATAANTIELRRNPIAGRFDSARLQETHRQIFGNVYPWAGELRKGIGIMAKDRSGFVVAYGPSENVPGALADTFAKLTAEGDLRGLNGEAIAARLAYYYSELDAIHAFREGNSRTLRVFTSDLAQSAGHRLDWALTAQTEEQRLQLYHARDLAVMRGDTSELTQIFGACLARHLSDSGRVTSPV